MMQCPQCGARYNDSFRFCGADGGRLEPIAERDPMIGYVLANAYRIQRRLGEGGYGVVYAADHERLPIKVAVKILSRSRSHDVVAVARFKREVEAEAVITHPHIIRVLDYGHDQFAGYYIVMEHLVGRDIGTLLELGKKFHVLDIFCVIEESGAALAAAHDMGIVHRDIKADNVFLLPDPTSAQGFTCKLLDFGVAKLTRPVPEQGTSKRGNVDLNSTMHSTLLGSPCTVSPEILRGESADVRADIYSFGAMLFEMFTGTILFAEQNIEAMLNRVAKERPPPPSEVTGCEWINPDLDRLLLQMLEKDPNRRPQTMADVLTRFDTMRKQVETAWVSHFLSGTWRLQSVLKIELDAEAAPPHDGLPPVRTETYVDMRPLNVTASRARPLILVIDDDRAIRDLERQLVMGNGFDCVALSSADDARQWMVDNPPPEGIVLDLLMPGLDGMSFLREVRSRGYQGPVVVCSSVSSAILRAEAEGLSGVVCVEKATELHRIPEFLREGGAAAYPAN